MHIQYIWGSCSFDGSDNDREYSTGAIKKEVAGWPYRF